MLKHCNQIANSILYDLVLPTLCRQGKKFKPDDHSEVVPLLPIPNRTVKRLSANDSAGSRVKVGHRQANIVRNAHLRVTKVGFLPFCINPVDAGGFPVDISATPERSSRVEASQDAPAGCAGHVRAVSRQAMSESVCEPGERRGFDLHGWNTL